MTSCTLCTVLNRAAQNVGVHTSLWQVWGSLGICWGVRWLDHMVGLFFFAQSPNWFIKWLINLTPHQQGIRIPFFSCLLQHHVFPFFLRGILIGMRCSLKGVVTCVSLVLRDNETLKISYWPLFFCFLIVYSVHLLFCFFGTLIPLIFNFCDSLWILATSFLFEV